MSATRLRYLPALDGLRAVAVLGVMLYHGQVDWVRGGFLGVDVFFVLSGFLITSLLLAEHWTWGSIDLKEFWLRRARRLLPALFLVVLAIAGYLAVLAEPEQRASIRGDALASLLYVANWRFVFSQQSYFDQYADPSPLRHMWSLAIEEQWYLLYPFLLLALLAWFGRRTGRSALVLAVLAVASAALMAALHQPGLDPSRAYYGTDTRAQTLLVGAALAFLLARPTGPDRGRRHTLLAAAGLPAFLVLLAVLALVHDSDEWLYTGGFLAVATLSAIVVGAAAQPTGLLLRVLSTRPLVLLGVISYGLYLWHWPVYVTLTPDRTGLHGPTLLAARLALTLTLATASYRLIERPIRTGALRTWRPPLARIATAASLPTTLAIVLAVSAAAGSVDRVSAPTGPVYEGPTLRVFLLGDSFPYGLRTSFRAKETPALVVDGSTQLGCGLLPYPIVVEGTVRRLDARCATWQQAWPLQLQRARPDVGVVFIGIGEQHDRFVDGRTLTFGTKDFADFLTRELDAVTGEMRRLSLPVALPTLPCHRVVDSGLGPDAKIINDLERVTWLNDFLHGYVRSKGSGYSIVDLDDYLCPQGYTTTKDGLPLRKDGLHFTSEGATLVWRWLTPRLAQLRTRSGASGSG